MIAKINDGHYFTSTKMTTLQEKNKSNLGN